MVQWTIDSIASANPVELSAQEKDDLYESIAWLESKDVPPDKYQPLFNITKEVMKYKGEQVESLLADLDILASSTGGGNEELQEELVKANRQVETLFEEIQAKDKELESERFQIEKLLSEMGELQKEKAELRRELVLIQTEGQSQAGGGQSGSLGGDDSSDDTQQLKEMIQQKNKHILQLLSDIQVFEKENELLNNKLKTLRRELSEATSGLEKFSGENISLRQNNQEFQEKIIILEERNAALSSQVSELVDEKNKREANLDILIDALEERVNKWQEILSQKDEEVTELKARLSQTAEASVSRGSNMIFSPNYLQLNKTIEEQEEAIKRLHEQLKQATEDMSNCSIQVQELKQKADSKGGSEIEDKTVEELKEELDKAHNQIAYLQEKVNDAEQDAQFRAEEMTELIIQLKEYEEGVYGLSEARSQVKELKRQLKTRDNQILKLIEQINQLTLQAGDGQQIDMENFEKYFEEEDQKSNIDLQTQLSAIQQTAINLSMQNFELRAQIVKMTEHTKKNGDILEEFTDAKGTKELEEKLKNAIEENESLRKGFHEILESIQAQDGSREVVIESDCLERLLEALDARHVAGWYHPAMRIQATLNKMQGSNQALRQELRESRLRESYFQAELQNALIQVGELQDQMKKYCDLDQPPLPIPVPRKRVEEGGEEEEGSTVPTPPVALPRRRSSGRLGDKVSAEVLVSGEEVPTVILCSPPPDRGESEEETLTPPPSAATPSPSNLLPLPPEVLSEPPRPLQIHHHHQLVDNSTQTHLPPTTLRSGQAQTEILMTQLDILKSSSKPGETDEKAHSEKAEETLSSTNGKVKQIDQTDRSIVESSGDSHDPKPRDVTDSKTVQEISSGTSREVEMKRRESSETDSSGSPRFKQKLIKIENDLKKKCDELKSEFEAIKRVNESAVQELVQYKQELFSEVEKALFKVNEEVKIIKEAESVKPPVSDFTLGAFKEQEAKLLSYGLELGDLRRALTEKENYIKFLEAKLAESAGKAQEVNTKQLEKEEKRIKPLKETISSLQQMVSQKEASCQRYKLLLEESNAEYGQLLEKYHSLERNSSTLPLSRDPMAESRSVSILMEKWIQRVHGLEGEIERLSRQLTEATADLEAARMEADKWRHYAESLKDNTVDDFTLNENRREIEDLRQKIKELKEQAEVSFQNRIHNDQIKFNEKEEAYKKRIKDLDSEITRLKHQLNIRCAKSTTKTVKKEVLLLDKIKFLEDELEKFRERERNQFQMRREKCADEVSKWEERKRLQTTNEKYRLELREKSHLVEQLEGQISRLKVIIARMERERISLQRRLKTSDGLLAKSASEEEKGHEYDENKALPPDSRYETPVLDSSPRSPAESAESDLLDPKIKVQSRRDLVKAITALKKVIRRLRSEHSNYYHKDYVEELQTELRKMENNYMDAVERALSLEEQLRGLEAKLSGQTYIVDSSSSRSEAQSEVVYLKELLAQKCSLLMKVKVLLQRALLREKQLIHQVSVLEKLVPPERLARLHEEAREL